MRQPLQRLSTKYALLFAALLSLVMLLVLVLAGYLVFESTNRLRGDLTESFSSIQSTNDLRALRASTAYLSNRLFNPLYNMDVSALNEEIAQIREWLEPVAIFIVDRAGRVVTDGSVQNSGYGRQLDLPRGLGAGEAVIDDLPGGQVIHFAIGFGDEVPGYARIELSDARSRVLVGMLQEKVADAWRRFERGFLTIALISMTLIGVLSLILGLRLSVSLSRPLRVMTRAAEQYAAGNLTHKLPDWSEDELGRLARSLNTMASDLEKAGALLNRAQEIAAFGSWETYVGSEELSLSHGVYQILGVAPGEFQPTIGRFLEFVGERDRQRLEAILKGRFEEAVSVEFDIEQRDGSPRILYLKGEPVLNANGRIEGFLGTLQDVTEQRRSQEQLMYLANYDHLTRLPNRNLFYDRLRHAAKKARRRSGEVALLFLDLDRFKAINDALGHDIGDELLRQVARRLEQVVRESDTLARMGGDEFTLIVEDLGDPLAPQRIAQHILDVLTAVFRIADRELFISASIGIAMFPKDADNIDTLVKNADTAMYVAKEQGRATFSFFTPELDRLAHERLAMEHEMRRAVEKQEFQLHFQPQVRAQNGKLVGLEALLRWSREGAQVPPDVFIPILEDTGLITRITGWVLETTCAVIERMREHGVPNIRVAVNLSARQFQQPDLPELIDGVLTRFGLDASQLELEITESTLLDREASQKNATEFAVRGVRLAIDDFGTGYSSLTYLKRFHVDAIKIDKSFVQDLLHDPDDAQITATVVALARGLGIVCIAEGVEQTAQLERLRSFGCDLVQGYLVCRPADIDGLMAWADGQKLLDTGCYWAQSVKTS